jgi:hypothetical protein
MAESSAPAEEKSTAEIERLVGQVVARMEARS